MPNIGDYVNYGNQGVCRIDGRRSFEIWICPAQARLLYFKSGLSERLPRLRSGGQPGALGENAAGAIPSGDRQGHCQCEGGRYILDQRPETEACEIS